MKLNDPSLRVITRDGYFGGEQTVDAVAPNKVKKQPKQLLFDLTAAARTTMIYSGLHIEPVQAKNGYLLKVKANDLTWAAQADGSRVAEVTVVAVGYSNRDKEVGQHAAELKQLIRNLTANPRASFVIGWAGEKTVQFEGEAFLPEGEELARYKKVYFGTWLDGPARQSWPGIKYFVVRPRWIRYSDFDQQPPLIEEQSIDG